MTQKTFKEFLVESTSTVDFRKLIKDKPLDGKTLYKFPIDVGTYYGTGSVGTLPQGGE